MVDLSSNAISEKGWITRNLKFESLYLTETQVSDEGLSICVVWNWKSVLQPTSVRCLSRRCRTCGPRLSKRILQRRTAKFEPAENLESLNISGYGDQRQGLRNLWR